MSSDFEPHYPTVEVRLLTTEYLIAQYTSLTATPGLNHLYEDMRLKYAAELRDRARNQYATDTFGRVLNYIDGVIYRLWGSWMFLWHGTVEQYHAWFARRHASRNIIRRVVDSPNFPKESARREDHRQNQDYRG